jgi:hypothetical protein
MLVKVQLRVEEGGGAYHVARGAGAGEEHVGGDLAEDVTDEEDRNTSLVLCTLLVKPWRCGRLTYQFP